MTEKKITVPLAQNNTNQCTITAKWFVDKSEYKPLLASFRLLINGEEAFREVYRAIMNARKSVSIVCWGFQPSMHFIRDGFSQSIGQLVEKKAQEGIKVRILCWALDPLWLGIGVTGKEESNAPGRRATAYKDRPPTCTDAQYRYDQEWYLRYDDDQKMADGLIKQKVHGLDDHRATNNLRFAARGFSAADRKRLKSQDHADKGLSKESKAILSSFPSHHQKMVLVDCEDSQGCVGFVMGHNMLDEYWDDDRHSAQRSMINEGRPEREPHRRANGGRPREDFSARVTGPIVGDLHHNFSVAWEKQTGEAIPKTDFSGYLINPPVSVGTGTADQGIVVKPGGKSTILAPRDPIVMGQILRTQPQYGVRHIKKMYLDTVTQATQYIYIENQYFRWPPLAEKIKECAGKQTCWGRKPQEHGPLYLFVITNTSNEGIGSGTVNTSRMLDSLGRADTIPEVARQERADDAKARLERTNYEIAMAEREQMDTIGSSPFWPPPPGSQTAKRYAAKQSELDAMKAKKKQQEEERKKIADKEHYDVREEDIPGLKVHVATLVAPDTREGQPWVEVYIHAKLMLIDDTFMTLGSANINTRSMEVDSELNITHHRHEITQPARKKLWQMHTGSRSGGEVMDKDGMKKAYKAWRDLMDENKNRRFKKQSPVAPLVEFLRTDPTRSNID